MSQWAQSSSPSKSVPPLHQHVNTPLGGPRDYKAHSGRPRPRRDSSGCPTVWTAPEREKQTTIQSFDVEQTPGTANHNRVREHLQHGAIGTVLVPFKDVPPPGKHVNTPSGAAGRKTDMRQHTRVRLHVKLALTMWSQKLALTMWSLLPGPSDATTRQRVFYGGKHATYSAKARDRLLGCVHDPHLKMTVASHVIVIIMNLNLQWNAVKYFLCQPALLTAFLVAVSEAVKCTLSCNTGSSFAYV